MGKGERAGRRRAPQHEGPRRAGAHGRTHLLGSLLKVRHFARVFCPSGTAGEGEWAGAEGRTAGCQRSMRATGGGPGGEGTAGSTSAEARPHPQKGGVPSDTRAPFSRNWAGQPGSFQHSCIVDAPSNTKLCRICGSPGARRGKGRWKGRNAGRCVRGRGGAPQRLWLDAFDPRACRRATASRSRTIT
jgi:hypothetical protein